MKIVKKNLIYLLPALVITVSGLIMLINTFTYPPEMSNDYAAHYRTVEQYKVINSLSMKISESTPHHLPLYYFIIGKFARAYDFIFQMHPFNIYRLFNILFYVFIAYLYCYKLLPKYISDKNIIVLFSILFFILPNFYLAQTQIRADQLLFFSLHLLFYLWYYYDFQEKIAESRWRQVVWALCLIVIANTRHIAIIGFVVFFTLGLWSIFRPIFISKTISRKKLAFIVPLVVAILVFSGLYYAIYFNYTGSIIKRKTINEYAEKKEIISSKADINIKLKMFFNMQFFELLRIPNRNCSFGELNGTKHLAAIRADDFEDKILNWVTKIEDKKLLRTAYTRDYDSSIFKTVTNLKENNKIVDRFFGTYKFNIKDYYLLRKDNKCEVNTKSQSIIQSVANHDNSYFPRIYGDMWADHWLLFSGEDRREDSKIQFKRVILVLAFPFFLFYFVSALIYSFKVLIRLIKKEQYKFSEIAGLMFITAFIILTILTVFLHPMLGKNSNVKFVYLLPYYSFPFFCMIDILKSHKKLLKIFFIYAIILFLFGIPLYIYSF